MKKSLAIVCLAGLTAAAGAAHAQSGGARGILGLGITTGGDTLASVTFTDGSTADSGSPGARYGTPAPGLSPGRQPGTPRRPRPPA